MTIVRHPSLDVTYDVPAHRVSEWLASGWLTDTPTPEPIDGLVIETDGGQLISSKPKDKSKK